MAVKDRVSAKAMNVVLTIRACAMSGNRGSVYIIRPPEAVGNATKVKLDLLWSETEFNRVAPNRVVLDVRRFVSSQRENNGRLLMRIIVAIVHHNSEANSDRISNITLVGGSLCFRKDKTMEERVREELRDLGQSIAVESVETISQAI